LDTNVFVSLYKEELGKNLRPLYIESQEFFNYIKQKNILLVLSELFFSEAYKCCYVSKKDIISYFSKLEIPLLIIEKENLALPLKEVHYPDSIHASTAIKYNCDSIITFNTKDFDKIKNKIKIFEPNKFQID
jgi:predicted nucleic acid-binding protein